MPSTGFAVLSRAEWRPGSLKQAMTKAAAELSCGDRAAERLDHRVGIVLAFDAGRPFMQRLADNWRPASKAQIFDRNIDRRGHRLGRVGIDDDDGSIIRFRWHCVLPGDRRDSLTQRAAGENAPQTPPTRDGAFLGLTLRAKGAGETAIAILAMAGSGYPGTDPGPARHLRLGG
jgi:hypothetical protein